MFGLHLSQLSIHINTTITHADSMGFSNSGSHEHTNTVLASALLKKLLQSESDMKCVLVWLAVMTTTFHSKY